MLPLLDTQVRLVLLNHVAVRLAEAKPDELHAAGIENEHVARLRQLSALDLNRLATMRDLTIGVSFDAAGLTAGLRTVSLVNEAKALEAYFIRHGASWQMMSALFKIRRKATLRRRQAEELSLRQQRETEEQRLAAECATPEHQARLASRRAEMRHIADAMQAGRPPEKRS
jgi:hypothetical protein